MIGLNAPNDVSLELQKIIVDASGDTLKRYLITNKCNLKDFTCHGFGEIERAYMAYVGINLHDDLNSSDIFSRRLLIQYMDDEIRTEAMKFEGEKKIKINVFKRHKFLQSKSSKKILFIGYYWNTA